MAAGQESAPQGLGQVVDTDTAREFMHETLERCESADLEAICAEVEAKSAWLRERLAPGAIDRLSAEDYAGTLTRIFSTRGKTRAALAAVPIADVRHRIGALLHGDDPVGVRLRAFVATLPEAMPDNLRMDFATELLHFTDPDRHWLWTRWMWDPRTRTGALPLVVTAAYRFDGDDVGDVYQKVGRAVAFVHEVGTAAGFQPISRRTFGTDVYLCCVYVIYAYTVLRMRMTKEFNRAMPELPEFCRRLLGVHKKNRGSAA